MSDDIAPENDRLLGRLKQLQTRYPALIREVSSENLVMTVEFYLADVAIDATYCLLKAGVTAVHRLDCPRNMSLQVPSLVVQHQVSLVVQILDVFLRRLTLAKLNGASVPSRENPSSDDQRKG